MKLEKGKIEMIPEEFYAMSQSITDQGNYIRQIILPGLHDLLDNVTTLLSDIYDSHHSQWVRTFHGQLILLEKNMDNKL
jgi:hypothetical protein